MLNSKLGQPVQYFLNGKTLRRVLHGKSPKERAAIAAQLFQHGVSLEKLSAAQLSRLCQTNESSVCIALGHAGSRGPQARTLDLLTKKYSPDVLMRALDRLTAPSMQAAE